MKEIDLFIRKIALPSNEQLDGHIVQAFLKDHRYDIELVILKGHMLIEHTIDISIEKLAFKKASTLTEMSFATKLLVAEALGMFEGDQGHAVTEQIRILSKIRNDIAHALSFNGEKFRELLKYHPELADKLNRTADDVHISLGLNFVFAFICQFISARLRTKINVNNLICDFQVDIRHLLSEEAFTLSRHRRAMTEFNHK